MYYINANKKLQPLKKALTNNTIINSIDNTGCVFISELSNRKSGYLVKISCNRKNFLEDKNISSIWAIRTVSLEMASFLENFLNCCIPSTDTLYSEIPNRKNTDLSYMYGINVDFESGKLSDFETLVIKLFKNSYDIYMERFYLYDDNIGDAPKFVSIDKFEIDDNGILNRINLA